MARQAKKISKRMAKKGATPKPPASSPSPALPNWVWLGSGIFIGLFVALLVYLQTQPVEQMSSSKPAQPVQAQPELKQAERSEPEAAKPRFEFYSILPEREVLIPEQEKVEKRQDKTVLKPISKPGQYVLQSGSFRRYADADRRRASLAILGVESSIQTVKIDDKETWHRVRVGPYQDLQELNEVRALLQENKIETLLIRIKG